MDGRMRAVATLKYGKPLQVGRRFRRSETAVLLMMMMMIDVLRPLLRTRQAKWAERPPKVIKRSHKDETTFRYARAEILTRAVVICGPTRYR